LDFATGGRGLPLAIVPLGYWVNGERKRVLVERMDFQDSPESSRGQLYKGVLWFCSESTVIAFRVL
jgi:hypothetical protein